MLRILSSSQLEGYVIKGRGGPPWELLAGTVAKIHRRLIVLLGNYSKHF